MGNRWRQSQALGKRRGTDRVTAVTEARIAAGIVVGAALIAGAGSRVAAGAAGDEPRLSGSAYDQGYSQSYARGDYQTYADPAQAGAPDPRDLQRAPDPARDIRDQARGGGPRSDPQVLEEADQANREARDRMRDAVTAPATI